MKFLVVNPPSIYHYRCWRIVIVSGVSDLAPCGQSCRRRRLVVLAVLLLSAEVYLLLDASVGFCASSLEESLCCCFRRFLVVVVVVLLSSASHFRCCFVVVGSSVPFCGCFHWLLRLVLVVFIVGYLIFSGVSLLLLSSDSCCLRCQRSLVVVVGGGVVVFSDKLILYLAYRAFKHYGDVTPSVE